MRLHQKTIQGLSYLFEEENSFWLNFEQLKKQYAEIQILEKKIGKQKIEIDEQLFKKLALGKSAICLAMAYALDSLSNSNLYTKDIISCLSAIHIAFQYKDDIDDFEKDIAEGQWTYPQSLLKTYLQQKDIDFFNLSSKDKYKYLFISHTAEFLIEQAISSFKEAYKIANKLFLNDLALYIQYEITHCEFQIKEINWLIQKASSKLNRSNVLINKPLPIQESIELGTNFLFNNLSEDGYWIDFMTSAGEGKTWVTAYIGLMLAEINAENPVLEQLAKNLLSKKHISSYNGDILQDGDSTNFVIGFLKKIGAEIPHYEMSKWYAFMDSYGGWATYKDEKVLKELLRLESSPLAWLTPKACVSAASAYVLSEFGSSTYLTKSIDYLLTNIRENHWQSYWWTSHVYATAFAVMAFTKNNLHNQYCEKGVQFLIEKQHKNGHWANEKTDEPSNFYTALAVKALSLYAKNRREVRATLALEKGISYLQKMQTTDGSWQSTRILQIPSTDIENPESVKKWNKSSFGVNILTDDYNRVFTTATVINALHYYQQI